jgi:hypothetical protein
LSDPVQGLEDSSNDLMLAFALACREELKGLRL